MQTDLIYDVGMHIGQDTDFYLRKGFRVVAIEANPELCALAEKQFSLQIERRQLTVLNRAIGKARGTIDFYLNEKNSVWVTANLDWVRQNERRGAGSRQIRVEATTIRDVFDEFGMPYYMKVDIEGSDILYLDGLFGCAERPRFVSVESSATSAHDTFE